LMPNGYKNEKTFRHAIPKALVSSFGGPAVIAF